MSNNIVIFGPTQSGKTTLLGYLATAMLRHPQLNDEILQNLKLIRNLTSKDEFLIGNPYNPVNVKKDVILPSFVSMDKDELRKFRDKESSEGTTKRIHRKQLTICISERDDVENQQNENANIPCTFLDIPGFRQRLSDKYRGFYEGDIGIAVLKIGELLELSNLINSTSPNIDYEKVERLERRLFEPIRVWCDYRSAARLIIVISQVDQCWDKNLEWNDALLYQYSAINKAIACAKSYTAAFSRNVNIPVSPISIRLDSMPNVKKRHRMSLFFLRKEENIYAEPAGKNFPGDGPLIKCLKDLIPTIGPSQNRKFSMASVNKPMRAIVNNSRKTALNIRALHGSLNTGDEVFLGPVLDKRDSSHSTVLFVKCIIESLKSDGTLGYSCDGTMPPSSYLFEGNVGGMICKSIKNMDDRTEYQLDSIIKNSDLAILKTTILFSGKVKCGNILELEFLKRDYETLGGGIDDTYSKILTSLMPFDVVSLFWYGKMVTVNIVEIKKSNVNICISVMISHFAEAKTPYFALPCNGENELLHHDNVLMVIAKSLHSSKCQDRETYTYVNATILDLKDSRDYRCTQIQCHKDMELGMILDGNVAFREHTTFNDCVIYEIPISDPHKHISIHSVLTKVKRKIKENHFREVYRDLGGIDITLIE